jgi:hypothetical protein
MKIPAVRGDFRLQGGGGGIRSSARSSPSLLTPPDHARATCSAEQVPALAFESLPTLAKYNRRTLSRVRLIILRTGLNEVSTLYCERDAEFLKTLQQVREITKEMEGPDEQKLAA